MREDESGDVVGRPGGWAISTLGEIADVQGGLAKGKQRTGEDRLRPVPYLRVANVQRGYLDLREVKEIEATELEIQQCLLKAGDVLFNEGGDRDKLGRGWVWSGEIRECIHQNHVFRARIHGDLLHSKLLSWYGNSEGQSYFLREGKQTTNLASLNSTKLRGLPIHVPPKQEQSRIVEQIESYFSRLDAAVATLERVERNLKRYRASVLKAAVEGRLVPTEAELARQEGRTYEPASVLLERILVERRRRWSESGKKGKYQEPTPPDTSNLPPLPEGWCWATVDQLATVGTGATPKRDNPLFWRNGTIPWITSSAVNERRVSTVFEMVTEKALSDTNLAIYKPGTILIAMYGEGKTRGMVSELAIEAATNQALAAISMDGEAALLRGWVCAFFMHSYELLRGSSSGGVQPNLNLGTIKSFAVPIPPLDEQCRIVSEADSAMTVSDGAQCVAKHQRLRCRHLRQSILKWAFEGKLADQDPSDEPASVLLARIQAERAASEAAARPAARKKPDPDPTPLAAPGRKSRSTASGRSSQSQPRKRRGP